jgi:hypothetical protein
MLACAFVAAGTGIATLHAVGHGGHIEIGPAALAHLKKTKPKPVPVVHKSREPTPRATSVAQLPLLRGGAHDSATLFKTANELEALGLDVTVVEVHLRDAHFSPDTFFPKSTPAVRGRDGHIDGVELLGIPRESPLRLVGITEGDQLLGINGYSFADDSIERGTELMHARNLGWTIVEIARGNHHVVFSIRWPVG